jgi:hypothetical protein
MREVAACLMLYLILFVCLLSSLPSLSAITSPLLTKKSEASILKNSNFKFSFKNILSGGLVNSNISDKKFDSPSP